jgi:hypothetical protein
MGALKTAGKHKGLSVASLFSEYTVISGRAADRDILSVLNVFL